MKKISLDSPRARARAALAVTLAALGLLGLVFFRTQVLRAGADVLVQQGNRLRAVPLPAPRGAIFDRHGVVLAGTESATALVLMPAPPDSIRARLERVAELLDLPDLRRERLELLALTPPRPLVVTTGLGSADVGMLVANRQMLPGVLLEEWPQRTYPAGHAVASVIGHVGSAPWPAGSGENLAGIGAGRLVGRAGLELAFDSALAGEAGLRYVEMDPSGGLVASATGEPHRRPIPGSPLRTRVDAGLQNHLAEVLPTRGRVAAVVVEIASGDVLALYSHPPYVPGREASDPEAQGHAGIALQEQPGAVFHPITAALALESGRIDLERPQAVPCRGGMRYGERYFRCWKADGHGQLALAGAIREGCDVYFHQIGLRLGLQALLEAGARMGLGRTTGLELPEERPGRFPATVTELAGRLGRAPNPSDALDLAAGQGLNETTLIRMTHTYASIANGGGAPAPRLTGAPRRGAPWRLELPPERGAALLDMLGSVTAPDGPGAAAGSAMSAGARIRGQLSRAREPAGPARPSGWFVGVAGPAVGPDQIAVGVLIEHAPSNEAPAALAGRIADYYLRNGRGEPVPASPDTTTLSVTPVSSS